MVETNGENIIMNKKNMIEYDLIKNIMSDDFINFLKQYSRPLEKIDNVWYLPTFWINQFETNKKDLTL